MQVMLINKVKPANLLKIPITINEKIAVAMIDTGSTTSIMKSAFAEKISVNINTEETQDIVAYGNNKIKTEGIVQATIIIEKYAFEVKFTVLENVGSGCDVILGLDFLKSNNVMIDITNRTVRIGRREKENVIFHVNINNEIDEKRYNNIPVFLEEDITIESGKSELIRINSANLIPDDYYFEGKDENDINFFCGIINQDTHEVIVRNDSNKKKTLKKNYKIGEMSSMIEEQREDEDEYWTSAKLDEKIELNHLKEEEKKIIIDMLMTVREALSTGDNDIGKAQITPHRIQLDNYTPIWQKPRQLAKPIEEEIDKQCQDLLANDIIECSNSSWSSPCVPIRKADGGLRLCLDYRKLNKVTIPEKFPMPNLNQCIYKANNVKFFTKIDLVRGYYQVMLDEESKKLTAFSTSKNHYQFKRLSFGLKNSGIAFQKMMQQILAPVESNNIIIYIDDVLIMSSSFEKHVELVKKVLFTLMKYGIKIKVKKCEFFKNEVSFLGHILSEEGIKKSSEYIDKVTNYPQPTTVKELRKFLGLINFQRKFIEQCSVISKPLTELTSQSDKTRIEWTEQRSLAYAKLKEEITRDITLTFPDYDDKANKLELYVDASSSGAGACLMQKQGQIYRVIGYNSMTFSQTQRNYSTTERELCAIRWGCEAFKPFIWGISFVLYTDHRPLIFMYNMNTSSARIQRTLEELSQFDFDIRYLPGVKNEAADFLSRMDNTMMTEDNQETSFPDNLCIVEKVDGGGNSLFEALIICIKRLQDTDDIQQPLDHLEMRKNVINELMLNMERYKIINNKQERNKLKLMKRPNVMVCNEALLAVSKLYRIEIRVYHDIKIPVVYSASADSEKGRVIYLQCKGFCHFNPLTNKQKSDSQVSERYINCIVNETNSYGGVDEDSINVGNLYELKDKKSESVQCNHEMTSLQCITKYNEVELCTIIDTGSQVSLISEDTWRKMRTGEEQVIPETAELVSVDGKKHEIIAVVNLKLEINGVKMSDVFPFCIVAQKHLPSCALIGINFLEYFRSSISFRNNQMMYDNGSYVRLTHSEYSINNTYVTNIEIREDNRPKDKVVELMISVEELKRLQDSNKAIKELKNRIQNSMPVNQCNSPALKQFKVYYHQLCVIDDILMIKRGKDVATVVTYPFMVEVLGRMHSKIAHVGRHKLLELVYRQFWHPATDKIAREICRCCKYCQLNKTNVQLLKPPTVKINIDKPFHLVSVDLINLPRTRRNCIGAMVVVDHCSKWMMSYPIKNKSAATVANILKTQILPYMVKIPTNILSDNGMEFRGKETEEVLKEFNIKHLYSSPYTPEGNGAVERVNRSLLNILKGLTGNADDWDLFLPKANIIYNNTFHSQIKASPADFLMQQVHDPSAQIPVGQDTTIYWKEGHPNFRPFKIGQRVIKEIARVGNRSSNKMSPKFDGPYIVKQIQSNGLSYVIEDNKNNKMIKCNHRKLRAFHELPWSIRKFLPDEGETVPEEDSMVEYSDGLVCMLSSDESSSFEGFSGGEGRAFSSEVSSSESSSDGGRIAVSSEVSSSESEGEQETDDIDVNNNEASKSLSQFQCSDVAHEGYLQSTPRQEIECRFGEFLKCQKVRDSLSFLDQSMSAQLELISIMETKLDELSISFNEAVTAMNKAMISDSNNVDMSMSNQSAIENFSGFVRGVMDKKPQETMSKLKVIMETCKKGVHLDKLKREELQREIWTYRQNNTDYSTLMTSMEEVSCIMDEVEDTVADLVPLESSTPRRHLRSHGKVPIYPNVQTDTLEYSLKRMNCK